MRDYPAPTARRRSWATLSIVPPNPWNQRGPSPRDSIGRDPYTSGRRPSFPSLGFRTHPYIEMEEVGLTSIASAKTSDSTDIDSPLRRAFSAKERRLPPSPVDVDQSLLASLRAPDSFSVVVHRLTLSSNPARLKSSLLNVFASKKRDSIGADEGNLHDREIVREVSLEVNPGEVLAM